MNLQEKISNVKNFIKDKKIAISFSGGADSTLIAYLAAQASDNPIATVSISLYLHVSFSDKYGQKSE